MIIVNEFTLSTQQRIIYSLDGRMNVKIFSYILCFVKIPRGLPFIEESSWPLSQLEVGIHYDGKLQNVLQEDKRVKPTSCKFVGLGKYGLLEATGRRNTLYKMIYKLKEVLQFATVSNHVIRSGIHEDLIPFGMCSSQHYLSPPSIYNSYYQG